MNVGVCPWFGDSLSVRIAPRWKDQHLPTPYPREFRADVVAVGRQGDKSRAQVVGTHAMIGAWRHSWCELESTSVPAAV